MTGWKWQRERCGQCRRKWTWDFYEGMLIGGAWPCGCPSVGDATLVLESSPGGCLRVLDERRGIRFPPRPPDALIGRLAPKGTLAVSDERSGIGRLLFGFTIRETIGMGVINTAVLQEPFAKAVECIHDGCFGIYIVFEDRWPDPCPYCDGVVIGKITINSENCPDVRGLKTDEVLVVWDNREGSR